MSTPGDLDLLLGRVEDLADAARRDGRRRVVGIAGPPGAGKTTLVEGLLASASGEHPLRGRVAHVPMDGFHLRDAELVRLGRRDRKGAPDTFDPIAYAAVLADLRRSPRLVVAAPAFDHWQVRFEVTDATVRRYDVAGFDDTLSYNTGANELTVYLNRARLNLNDGTHANDYTEIDKTTIELEEGLLRVGDILWIVRANPGAPTAIPTWKKYPPGTNCAAHNGDAPTLPYAFGYAPAWGYAY